MQKLLLQTLIASIIAVGIGSSPAQALSLTGQQIDNAVKEDFFVFFHLRKRAIDERDNLATHYFRPSSRGDIVVCVDTDKQGKILQMSLIVGRDFVDQPETNVFARDLVKSFIEAATPPAVAEQTSGVVNEIFFRGNELTPTRIEKVTYNGKPLDEDKNLVKIGAGELKKGDRAIMIKGSPPKLPEEVSDSYRAFEGKLKNSDLKIAGAHLIMKNHEVAKGRYLEVRVDVDDVKTLTDLNAVEGEEAEEPQPEKGKENK